MTELDNLFDNKNILLLLRCRYRHLQESRRPP